MSEQNNKTSDLLGKVLSPKNLVEFQDGSVVSRTLINKNAGTVTLFSFDKNESLSEHTAPFDAMILVLEGHVAVTIGGKDHSLGQGEMIIMPANIPHGVKANEKMKMMLVMIKG